MKIERFIGMLSFLGQFTSTLLSSPICGIQHLLIRSPGQVPLLCGPQRLQERSYKRGRVHKRLRRSPPQVEGTQALLLFRLPSKALQKDILSSSRAPSCIKASQRRLEAVVRSKAFEWTFFAVDGLTGVWYFLETFLKSKPL